MHFEHLVVEAGARLCSQNHPDLSFEVLVLDLHVSRVVKKLHRVCPDQHCCRDHDFEPRVCPDQH